MTHSRRSHSATPAGTTATVYDPDGLVTSITDANSHTSSQTFDNNGRPLITTKARARQFAIMEERRHDQ